MKVTAVFPWDDWTLVGALVVVGMLVVFLILIILICVFALVGKAVGVIDGVAEKRADNKAVLDIFMNDGIPELPPAIVAQPHPLAVLPSGRFPGISGETVAAITAAVTAYSGGTGVVTGIVGIRRSRDSGYGGRTRWGQAGVYGNLK